MKKLIILAAAAIAIMAAMAACNSGADENPNAAPGSPLRASIDGETRNRCLAEEVVLAAFAQKADSWEWTKDGQPIESENGATLTVTQSGTYTVAGINEKGKGLASPPHRVDITACEISIAGGQTNVCPEERVMLVAEAYDTSRFLWKKDGTPVEGQTAATLYVSQNGSYTVAPVYHTGTGPESEPKTVTVNNCVFVDVITGQWDVAEKWIWMNDFYDGRHIIFIEKVDDNNIKIYNFTGEGIQEQVVDATVDNDARTITIPYQKIITDGSSYADMYLAGLRVSSAPINSIDFGIGTLQAVGKGKGMTISFPSTVEIADENQTVFNATWQLIAFKPGTDPVIENLWGSNMVGMETVWTKK